MLLRLAKNHFWLSLADSDVLFWAQGVAVNSNLDVKITEPDVSPLQLQGPNSGEIMIKLFGESIKDLKYYWLKEINLNDIPLIISRTGWSSELGYELYLRDGSKGNKLWDKNYVSRKKFWIYSLATHHQLEELKGVCYHIMQMQILIQIHLSLD